MLSPIKPTSKHHWLIRYGATLAAVGAGLLLRAGLDSLVGKGLPTYITFYPVIMVVALLGGVGPGLLATFATALAVDYWILPPAGIGVASLVDAVGLAFFSGMGTFMSVVAELYRRARQKAAAYEKLVPPWESRAEPPQRLAERLLINGGMVLSLAILAAAGWQAHRNMASMVEADRWVTHAYVANEEIEHFLMALQDMDSSVRGYLITGQEQDLGPYTAALREPANRLAALKAETRDNTTQMQRVARLEALVGPKLAVLKETIELRRTKGLEAAKALIVTGKSQALTEAIRQQMDEAQKEEERLLQERILAKDASLHRARQALLSGGVLGFLLLAAVFVFLRQENAGRRQAEAELRRHRDHLQEIVAARTAELQTANESFGSSRQAALSLMEEAVRARKQAEQAAADVSSAAEQRRLALEAADLGAWDYQFQTGAVFWDERCREMWGIPQAEKIEYEEAIAAIHPEDRAEVDEAVKQALAGKDEGAYHREFRVVWPDGSARWIASHGRVYFQGEADQRHAIRFIGANQDITRRKQREEELKKLYRTLKARSKSDQALLRARGESEYLEAVCRIVVEDCGHAMVWIGFAEDDEARTVRPTAQAGYEEGYLETLNVTWADTERGRGPTGTAIRTAKPSRCRNVLTDPGFAPWREEAVKRGYASSLVLPLLADGRAFGALTIYARQPDGFSDEEVALLTELAGDLAYGITALRLRAAKERAEEALRQTAEDLQRSNRDLEQFAYVASHDLQEPLRAVGGYVKLLEHRFPDRLDTKARAYIAGAFDGATRMEQLISDLLDFSRVATRGDAFLPADLEEALGQALRNLEAGVQSTQAAVSHDPLPTLSVDAGQIRQLFQNLIGNALKFHGEQPPTIHVGAQRQDGRWVFSVRDNGIGIEPQYYEKIFQVFQRLHTRQAYSGTGIGLAICKKIVERHGGTIWVESQPGQGSTFYFSIPDATTR